MADLVEPERFKSILRHYHERANRKPNAFVIWSGQDPHSGCPISRRCSSRAYRPAQALRLQASADPLRPHGQEQGSRCANLSPTGCGRSFFSFPSSSWQRSRKTLETGRLDFVKAQVAIAIDFELVIPLRPQNLSRLNWQRHFSEPDGPKGRLLLHIPAAETKSRRQDFVAEVPEDVAAPAALVPASHPAAPQRRRERRSVRHQGRAQEGSEDHHHSNHQGDRAPPRHPHDATPVPAPLRDTLISRRIRRTSRRPGRCSAMPGPRPR